MKKWEKIFTEADRAILKKFGRAEKQPFGKGPALIIVDVVLHHNIILLMILPTVA